jgi:hydrogenase nickel incorporation protein HypA/HybF
VHELAIIEGVVEQVTGRLPDAKICCVRLEIGELSGVVPGSLRFCFDLATRGTGLQGASLEITEIPGRCRCRTCGRLFAPEHPPILLCPCGSADAEVLAGHELTIASVKVA